MSMRNVRGFTIIELLIVAAMIAILAFMGPHSLPYPWTLFLPYGSIFMFAIVLVTAFIESAWIASDRRLRPWRILKVVSMNVLCVVAGLATAVLIARAAAAYLGAAESFAHTRLIFAMQLVVIVALPLGLRLIVASVSRRQRRYPRWLARRTVSQTATALAVILPGLLLNRFSLLYHVSFGPDTAFTTNASALVYYADPDGAVRRVRIDGSRNESVGEKLKPGDLLLFGEPPDRQMRVYELDPKTSRPITCSDCRFTSEAAAAYLRPVESATREWRHVYRSSGLHAELWRPVYFMRDSRQYSIYVMQRYHAGNDECLSIEPFANNPSHRRIPLRGQMPTVEWTWRYVYYLPGDEVLAQLGNNIVLLDLNTMRMGFLAKGSRPVVTSL